MNASQQIPIISPDAGDTNALQDPNSPASIMKKAKEMEAQTAADRKFDATAPPREGFEDCNETPHEITHALLLATSVLLLLYAAAPNQG
jgi:hypothetical protein